MIISTVQVAIRNLLRRKGFSLMNILGLALGMAVCLIVYIYTDYELAYDSHFDNADAIYRVAYIKDDTGGRIELATTPIPLADALSNSDNQRFVATQLIRAGNLLVSTEVTRHNEKSFLFADNRYFNVFNSRFLHGDSDSALTLPNSVVLTRSSAITYFNETNVIGRTLTVEGRQRFVVTGVVEDYPANSHIQFNVLASYAASSEKANQSWLSKSVYTYVRVVGESGLKKLRMTLDDLVTTKVAAEFEETSAISFQTYLSDGNEMRFFLQPLRGIYLWSRLSYELDTSGDGRYLVIFSIAAVSVLLLACLNFLNLMTARFSKRYREVGLRKALGATRFQLITQFVLEAIIIGGFSLILAYSMVELCLPVFNFFTGLNLEFAAVFTLEAALLSFGFIFLLAIIAGAYPALYLSSFSPIDAIRGQFRTRPGHIVYRKALLTLQMVGLITLFMSTVTIYKQLSFLSQNQFSDSIESIVVIPRAYVLKHRLVEFQRQLMSIPGIDVVSVSRDVPGGESPIVGLSLLDDSNSANMGFNIFETDDQLFSIYGAGVSEGSLKSFAVASAITETVPAVINEVAARRYGWESPIGMTLGYFDPQTQVKRKYQIQAVVQDFHFESLRKEIQPLLIAPGPVESFRYVSFRVSNRKMENMLARVEAEWSSMVPDRPFEYYLIDDDLRLHYIPEHKVGQVFLGFTLIVIMLTCFGLIGLITFNIERRTVELGLRKVLGASSKDITWLLFREIGLLLIISIVLAWPMTYFGISFWLNQFAYRIQFSIGQFFGGLAFAFLFTGGVISYQVLSVAFKRPISIITARR